MTTSSGNIKISIIHPTRRNYKAWQTKRAWEAAACNPFQFEYLIIVDEELFPGISRVERRFYSELNIHFSRGSTSVEANNVGARIAQGDLFLMLSDDTDEPEKGWDNKLLSLLPENWETTPFFVGIGDSIHNPNGSSLFTFPLS